MALTQFQIASLEKEYGILHLIYHRSKNQHRQQIWFRYLDIIHRKVRKIIKLAYSSANKLKPERILEVIKYLVLGKVFRKAFFEFNGIVALGQYINLGFALLGSVSAIYSILTQVEGAKQYFKTSTAIDVKETLAEDDMGEVIDMNYMPMDGNDDNKDADKIIENSVPKKTIDDLFSGPDVNKPKTKKKKKKTMDDVFGKNTIDDIFDKPKTMDDIFDKPKKKKAIDDVFDKPKKKRSMDDVFGKNTMDDIFDKPKKKKKKKSAMDEIFG